MGFFSDLAKVVATVAASAAAVVTLPVSAPIAAALAVTAAAGTAAGVASRSKEASKNSKQAEYQRGYEQAKAESAATVVEMKERIEALVGRLHGFKEYETAVVAMFAVGISVANCDGAISDDERRDVGEIIQGVSHELYPAQFRETVELFYRNPPTLEQALQYVKTVDQEHWDIFEEIIRVVSMSDGMRNQYEEEYLQAWHEFGRDHGMLGGGTNGR